MSWVPATGRGLWGVGSAVLDTSSWSTRGGGSWWPNRDKFPSLSGEGVGTLLTRASLCHQLLPLCLSLLSLPLQFNWYTRRAVLTGIYNTTELVMMQDSSPDFEDTWRFLEKRVADAMTMSNTAQQVTARAGCICHVPVSPRTGQAAPALP